MRRRTALKLPLAVGAGVMLASMPHARAAPTRWTADQANRWYRAQGWLVGSNYVPATAINQLEMFQPATFDARRINTELNWARLCGFNTMRVFLHDQLWAADKRGFTSRLSQFLGIAARNRIKPMLVFFDSCWDPHPKAGAQRAPRRGIHNSGWAQSPGADRIDDKAYRAVLREYVTSVMTQFRNDDRVLAWDVWNEPDNMAKQYASVERSDKLTQVADLLPQVLSWARSVGVRQPITSGVWDGSWADPSGRTEIQNVQLTNSDVITFHSYDHPSGFSNRIDELEPQGRPILCTEYMARQEGSTVQGILPVAKRRNVGVYNWGLVAGKSQTYYPWDSWDSPYSSIPKVWFHDLLRPDGKPHQNAEIQAVQRLTGRL
ncbi:MAG TPA: cellulase family glycosylhydrolase [Mycolicibacillus parakoreensis]|nr:cellulase family glycosylhydrolase [Mycolicibacillus parakoreensis]